MSNLDKIRFNDPITKMTDLVNAMADAINEGIDVDIDIDVDHFYISPLSFGDKSNDDTSIIQQALDSLNDGDTFLLPKGIWYVKNLIIPNKRVTLLMYGTLKAIGGGNPDYLLASANYVYNNNYAGVPVRIVTPTIDGSGIVTNGLVIQSWSTSIESPDIYRCVNGLKMTTETINGTAFTDSTLVNNSISNPKIYQNSGRGIWVRDPSRNKLSDYFITNGLLYQNGAQGIYLECCAGSLVQGIHTYANDLGIYVSIGSIGFKVHDCYFEEPEAIQVGDFNSSTYISFKGNTIMGTVDIYTYNENSGVISTGNTFKTENGKYVQVWGLTSIISTNDSFESEIPYTVTGADRNPNSAAPNKAFAQNCITTAQSGKIIQGMQEKNTLVFMPEPSDGEPEPVVDSNVNVKQYGAVGDGVADDTEAFRSAILYAKTIIIDSYFTEAPVVIIPGGTYKITGKLTIPPYIKLKSAGMVIISSTIASGSTIHITHQLGDPSFLDIFPRQQYTRSPIINGVDGGILLVNTNKANRYSNNSIGIEIGSTSDLGTQFPTSRYAIEEVAVEGFNVGIQMNKFHNYIGTFTRLMIETNAIGMRFGSSSIDNVTNSGENFNFYGCIFADGQYGFEWFLDGMNCNFYGCSFDYLQTIFMMRRSWKTIAVFGGHMEGMFRWQNEGGIASYVDGESEVQYPQLILDSVVVFANMYPMITGKIILDCRSVRWQRTSPNRDMYICDDQVIPKEFGHFYQGFDSLLSPTLNLLNNGDFSKVTGNDVPLTGVKGLDLVDVAGFTSPVVLSTNIPWGRFPYAMYASATTDGNNYVDVRTEKIPTKAGDLVQFGFEIYINTQATTARNIECYFECYDSDEALITIIPAFVYYRLDNVSQIHNLWSGIVVEPQYMPVKTAYVAARPIVSAFGLSDNFYLSNLCLIIS